MTDHPKRIQRKRTKGWRKPEGAVIVDRTSKFGNHFIVGEDGIKDNLAAREAYRKWITSETAVAFIVRARVIYELRGKDLVCWCPLDQPCHADVLLELANTPHLNKEGE